MISARQILNMTPEEAEAYLTDQMRRKDTGPGGMTLPELTASMAPIVLGLLARVWHLEQQLARRP